MFDLHDRRSVRDMLLATRFVYKQGVSPMVLVYQSKLEVLQEVLPWATTDMRDQLNAHAKITQAPNDEHMVDER